MTTFLQTKHLIARILDAHFEKVSIQSTTLNWLRNPETGQSINIDIFYPNFDGKGSFLTVMVCNADDAMDSDFIAYESFIEQKITRISSLYNTTTNAFHMILLGYDRNGKPKDTWTVPELIDHINYQTSTALRPNGFNIPSTLPIPIYA